MIPSLNRDLYEGFIQTTEYSNQIKYWKELDFDNIEVIVLVVKPTTINTTAMDWLAR